MTSERLFLIGLDAADIDLITDWVAEGLLPNFADLLKTSLHGGTENPRGLEAGAVWPAFYYGLRPGRMAQFDGARVFDSTIYDHRSYQSEESTTPPIWSTLSKAGKRCGVIDAPYNYRVDNINGMKVSDRGLHVPSGGGDFMKFATHPPELKAEIEALFGTDPAHGRSSDFFPLNTVEEINEFRHIYRQRIENKTELILHYWQKEPWDFFMSVFTEAHCAGHRCWHFHDQSHPLYNPELVAKAGNPLKDIYVALDAAIGKLVANVKDDAKVIVYLSHGMGLRASGTRLLDRMLARMDNQNVAQRSGLFFDTARKVWRHMPEMLRKPFLTMRNNITNDGFQPNREGRRFFEVYANDRTAGIRINLQGREPNGIVAPSDYDKVCQQLVEAISTLKRVDSSDDVVREIIITRNHYSGPFLDMLPDLLVTWKRDAPITGLASETFGNVNCDGIDMVTRTGDHRILGHFFGIAPDWQAAELTHNVKAEDFVPTIATLLGVPVPTTDGQPISELVYPSAYSSTKESSVEQKMVRYAGA